MENYQTNQRKIDVELENNQVANDIGELTVGSWVKYGPYDVTVSDGTLNIEFINVTSDPHVMGMAIYQAASASAGTTTYTYDNNGNMLSDGLKLYEYNEANQLKRVKSATNSATVAEYLYDYTGKRIIKKNYVNGSLANTVTSWTPSFETTAINGGGTSTIVYYYANNELVARKNNDGTRTFYHTDHLGSTSVLTNQAGSLVEATSYDPYGKVLSGGTSSRFQYTGKEKDSETGLNYYESRYYSSDIHSFAQPDTMLPNIYDPQQLNRYSYANNNPLRYTDPSGHGIVEWAQGLFGNKEKKQEPVSTKQVQKMFGTSEVKFNNNNSSNGSTNNSSGGITLSNVAAVGGAVVSSTNSYSVYVGEQQGAIKYSGITRQTPTTRFAQHAASGDQLKSTLNYRTLHFNLSRIVARGSEQTYIEAYKLIENGANRINGISLNNPIYQQAKDAAYAAGAVPGALGATSVMDVVGAVMKIPTVIIDYNSAANSLIDQQVN